VCPHCHRQWTFREFLDATGTPHRDPAFFDPVLQCRYDARVFCSDCEAWFLPALLVIDGDHVCCQVQLLGRLQTIAALEFWVKDEVLTRNEQAFELRDGNPVLLNDLDVLQLADRIDLILHVLLYSGAEEGQRFLARQNREARDLLFGGGHA